MLDGLYLQGFKSFSERTFISFEGGVTAVVGPNGSGKSNVVEALRWVTHSARARELRASRASDLIFHGGQNTRPHGMAEVLLDLRHGGEKLHLERRIYSSGEGEIRLGQKSARVRDVQSALRGSGLGPGGMAIIGQGEVAGVVAAEAPKLLGFLQEAAGLSKTAAIRQETAQSLAEAEQTLAELGRLQNERAALVEKQATAARAAEQAMGLQARLQALEFSIARATALAAAEEAASLREKVRLAEEKSSAASERAARCSQTLDGAREALATAKSEDAQHSAALQALEASKTALTQAKRYAEHLQNEEIQLKQELAALPSGAPTREASDLEALQQAHQEAKNALQAAERALQVAEKQGEERQSAALQAARAAAQQSEQLAAYQREKEHIAREKIRLEALRSEASERLSEAKTALSALEGGRPTDEDTQEKINAAKQQLRNIEADLAHSTRESERLQRILQSHASYAEGPRRALQSGHEGIVGSVAACLRMPPELESAVQAALGRRLEHVVVHTAEDAKALVELLRKNGGRATFLPLDLLRVREPWPAHWEREAGALGFLSGLCGASPEIIASALLGDTLVMQDVDAATRLARAHRRRPRMVTLNGEIFESSGAITGGRLQNRGGSSLADGRRLRELLAQREDLQRARESAMLALQKLQQTAAAEAERKAAFAAKWQEAESALRAAELQQSRVGAEAEALARAEARLLPPAALPTVPTETVPLPLEDLRAKAKAERTAEAAARDALADGRAALQEWQNWEKSNLRRTELQRRINENAAAATAQAAQVAHAEQEFARRKAALPNASDGLNVAERAFAEASQAHAAALTEQSKALGHSETLRLQLARKEGALSPVAFGNALAGTPRDWEKERASLTRTLNDLGPINPRAAHDHAEALALWQETEQQAHDATEAAEALREHLQATEAEEQRSIEVALGSVSEAFSRYSAELLGGSGTVEAEKNDAGRVTGLRLSVQPSGKRTRALSLLSTGERTMAGLAFLFALAHASKTGGLPLAVLDEVDAPLDEANIRRFAHFLRHFAAQGTQFVVITHQKTTMEVADAIWGVTGDGAGSSRVLSIRQAEG